MTDVDQYALQRSLFGGTSTEVHNKAYREELHAREKDQIPNPNVNPGQYAPKGGRNPLLKVVQHANGWTASTMLPGGKEFRVEGNSHREAVSNAIREGEKLGHVFDPPKEEPEISGLFHGGMFDEKKHPREQTNAGTKHAGQFAPKNTPQQPEAPFVLQRPKKNRKVATFENNANTKQNALFDTGKKGELPGQNLLFNSDAGDMHNPATMENKVAAKYSRRVYEQFEQETERYLRDYTLYDVDRYGMGGKLMRTILAFMAMHAMSGLIGKQPQGGAQKKPAQASTPSNQDFEKLHPRETVQGGNHKPGQFAKKHAGASPLASAQGQRRESTLSSTLHHDPKQIEREQQAADMKNHLAGLKSLQPHFKKKAADQARADKAAEREAARAAAKEAKENPDWLKQAQEAMVRQAAKPRTGAFADDAPPVPHSPYPSQQPHPDKEYSTRQIERDSNASPAEPSTPIQAPQDRHTAKVAEIWHGKPEPIAFSPERTAISPMREARRNAEVPTAESFTNEVMQHHAGQGQESPRNYPDNLNKPPEEQENYAPPERENEEIPINPYVDMAKNLTPDMHAQADEIIKTGSHTWPQKQTFIGSDIHTALRAKGYEVGSAGAHPDNTSMYTAPIVKSKSLSNIPQSEQQEPYSPGDRSIHDIMRNPAWEKQKAKAESDKRTMFDPKEFGDTNEEVGNKEYNKPRPTEEEFSTPEHLEKMKQWRASRPKNEADLPAWRKQKPETFESATKKWKRGMSRVATQNKKAINEGNPDENIASVASEYEIDHEPFSKYINEMQAFEQDQWKQREAVKSGIRKAWGVHGGTLRDMENKGLDNSSLATTDNLKGNLTDAQIYEHLGSDEGSWSQNAWDMLREDPPPKPGAHDREWLDRHAHEFLRMQSMHQPEPVEYQEPEDGAPFSRRSLAMSADRYFRELRQIDNQKRPQNWTILDSWV